MTMSAGIFSAFVALIMLYTAGLAPADPFASGEPVVFDESVQHLIDRTVDAYASKSLVAIASVHASRSWSLASTVRER